MVFFSGERAARGPGRRRGAALELPRGLQPHGERRHHPILAPGDAGAIRLFLSSAYGTGAALLELRSDAAGGVTAEELYFTRNMRAHHATPILVDGVLYGFSDSILTALDIETGALFWRDRSISKGSLTFADGRLYIFSERGEVALVEPSRTGYREHGRFRFPESDRSRRDAWSHPVVANGRLYLRDQDVLLAYDIRAGR